MAETLSEHYLFHLLPYLFSLALTLSLAVFTFRRRSVLGARSFSIVLFIEMLQTGGYILELVDPTLPGKALWDNLQWFTTLLFPVCVLFFTHEYSGVLRPSFHRWVGALTVIALLLGGLIVLDVFPGWGVLNPRLVAGDPFSLYLYDFGPLTLAASAYSYVLVLAGLIMLAREMIMHQQGIYRLQTLIILIGLLVPVAGTVLVFLDIDLLPNRDISPITFALADFLIVLGLFRYKIFDIM